MKNTGEEIIAALKKEFTTSGLNVVIIPHENPDGDAIGSSVGLAEILTAAGNQVCIISPNSYPDFLKWFASDVEILIYDAQKKRAKKKISEANLMFCLDFNDPKRAGRLQKKIEQFENTRVLIDHHPHPVNFCEITISETTYSSTAELVYEVAKRCNLLPHFNKNAAEAIYTGILTDTGSFSHNITNPNTFKVVSEIIQVGVDTDKIHSHVYHNFSANRMKLLGYCLNEKMEVFPEFRAAMISISKEELERFDFKPGDTEGFVNYPLSISNIVFSALFIEKEGFVKASFRSKGNFPANAFSSENFNGGGHLNAAGGESRESFEKTLQKFKQLLQQYKHQLLETNL